MRNRGVLCCAILLVAAAGCARDPEPVEPAAPPPWSEPASYKFVLRSDCGEQPLIGTYAVTVTDGAVSATEGLDEAARRSLMLRIANLVPTLGAMVDQADEARAQGAQVTVENDPADGHPTAIRIDPEPNAVDDETCYEITQYTIGGQPGPSASPSR